VDKFRLLFFTIYQEFQINFDQSYNNSILRVSGTYCGCLANCPANFVSYEFRGLKTFDIFLVEFEWSKQKKMFLSYF